MISYMLCAHLLGDFYLQWDDLAHAKKSELSALWFHCIIYALVFLIVGILNGHIILMGLVALCHLGIDFLFFKNKNNTRDVTYSALLMNKLSEVLQMKVYNYPEIRKRTDENESRNLFLLDQGLHVVVLLVFSKFIWIETPYYISVLLSVLMIYKPASVLIKNLTMRYNIASTEINSETKAVVSGAGSLIGYMERTIMMVTLLSGDTSLMIFGFGFILTAKTISRYGKTREDENFAQYFVIGTMMSILITLFSSAIGVYSFFL